MKELLIRNIDIDYETLTIEDKEDGNLELISKSEDMIVNMQTIKKNDLINVLDIIDLNEFFDYEVWTTYGQKDLIVNRSEYNNPGEFNFLIGAGDKDYFALDMALTMGKDELDKIKNFLNED